MPSVDELLLNGTDTLDDVEALEETNKYCEIDETGRVIVLNDLAEILGVENDKAVERVYFRCPRYVGDNVDLDITQCTVYINFQNANMDKDQYIVTDLNIDETDSTKVTFSWLLSKKVTQYKGIVNFIVCARKTKTGGEIEQEWNTTLAKATVLEGLEPDPYVVPSDDLDVVNQLMDLVKQEIEQKGQETLATIPSDYTTVAQNALSAKNEVEDIRVGADGTTYDSAGEAVRGQVGKLSEDIKNSIIYDVTGEKIKGSAIDTRDGTIRDFEKSISGDFIDVSDRNAVFYYTGNTYNYLGIAGYDDNGDYIQSILDSTDKGLVNFKNYRLDIPENVKKIRASSFGTSDNVGSMYNAEPFSVFKKYDVSSISGETQNLKNDKTMNHIYVSVNGSDASGDGTKENPYKTIYHANDIINDNSPEKQYIIHVADGTYNDLQARYNGIVGDTYQGVICKDYVYYIGNTKSPEKVIISWDGSTGFENPVLDDVFRKAPFHITGNKGLGCHTSIRGFSFECKNLRYPIHVETSGYGEDVEWTIENCDFRMWSGRPDVLSDNSQSRPSIGMGSSYFEEGCIRNCVFPEPIEQAGKTWSLGIVNHDNIRNNFNPYCKVGASYTIENCSFNGSDIMLRSGYKDATYDVKNIATIKNCTGINKLTYQISSEIVTEIMWNVNVICSEINQNSFN